jgi:hypothetical protein
MISIALPAKGLFKNFAGGGNTAMGNVLFRHGV